VSFSFKFFGENPSWISDLHHATCPDHFILRDNTRVRLVKERNEVMRPTGPGNKNDCAGEGQQQFVRLTDRSMRRSNYGAPEYAKFWF
jgi:hypothetical protein